MAWGVWWAVGTLLVLIGLSVLPAHAVAITRGAAPLGARAALRWLAPRYGPDAAAYLGAAPQAVVVFAVCVMTFLPLVAITLGAVLAPGAGALSTGAGRWREQARIALSGAGVVLAINVAAHGVCALALGLTRVGPTLATAWLARLCLATSLGALPYVGLAELLGAVARRPLLRVALGVVAVSLVAVLAQVGRALGHPRAVVTAAVDGLVLSAAWSALGLGAGLAVACWGCLVAGAIALRRRRARGAAADLA